MEVQLQSTPERSHWDGVLKQLSPGVSLLINITQKQPDGKHWCSFFFFFSTGVLKNN